MQPSRAEVGKFKGLVQARTGANPDEPGDEGYQGRCASVPRGNWVRSLTIQYLNKPWETFSYKFVALRAGRFAHTWFEIGFADADENCRVVVTGRNLEQLYNWCQQGRTEWMWEAGPGGRFEEKDIVIDKIEVAEYEEGTPPKRQRGRQDESERGEGRGVGGM